MIGKIKILDILHDRIRQNPKVQILRLTEDEARAYHKYLFDYHLNLPPAFEDMKGKMQFLGRKIEVYEPSEMQ